MIPPDGGTIAHPTGSDGSLTNDPFIRRAILSGRPIFGPSAQIAATIPPVRAGVPVHQQETLNFVIIPFAHVRFSLQVVVLPDRGLNRQPSTLETLLGLSDVHRQPEGVDYPRSPRPPYPS